MKQEKEIAQIKKHINKLKPYLNQDGGDIEFVKFEDGIVYIRLLGACIDCHAIDVTLKEGIERSLMDYIPSVIGVVNVGV